MPNARNLYSRSSHFHHWYFRTASSLGWEMITYSFVVHTHVYTQHIASAQRLLAAQTGLRTATVTCEYGPETGVTSPRFQGGKDFWGSDSRSRIPPVSVARWPTSAVRDSVLLEYRVPLSGKRGVLQNPDNTVPVRVFKLFRFIACQNPAFSLGV